MALLQWEDVSWVPTDGDRLYPPPLDLNCSWGKLGSVCLGSVWEELEAQLCREDISPVTAYAGHSLRRRDRGGWGKRTGRKERSQKDREGGGGGRAGGKEKGLAISNYWVINSRPHARYLHLHCLNFPQHGTMSVNEVMVFMATQWKGFCLHASMAVTARGIVNPVGLSKFSLNDFNVLIKSSFFF